MYTGRVYGVGNPIPRPCPIPGGDFMINPHPRPRPRLPARLNPHRGGYPWGTGIPIPVNIPTANPSPSTLFAFGHSIPFRILLPLLLLLNNLLLPHFSPYPPPFSLLPHYPPPPNSPKGEAKERQDDGRCRRRRPRRMRGRRIRLGWMGRDYQRRNRRMPDGEGGRPEREGSEGRGFGEKD